MADRLFANTMADFVTATSPPTTTTTRREEQGSGGGTEDSVLKLVSMPYSHLSQLFQRSVLDLKETIVMETWGLNGQVVQDFTLYSGTLGTAFLLFHSYTLTPSLFACVLSRLATLRLLLPSAVAAKYAINIDLQNYYLDQFGEVKPSRSHPDELLYGRSGYLWSCLFVNKHIGDETIPRATIRAVASEIIGNGRKLAEKGGSPLMYECYGERYWGAAHGLAGIMHVLMDVDLKLDEVEDVKGTLKYMIRNRLPSGNYPISEEDRTRDVLVHWCHGAPGIALTLVKAAKVFEDTEFLQAAVDTAELVWNRGLLKRVGICHGISGNAYVFLSLYRMTGNIEFLCRAKAFSCFLLDRAHMLLAAGEMHGGDSPYSLFEGKGGMAHLFLDMVEPLKAKFPGYEL